MHGVGLLRRWVAAIVMVVPLAAMSLPALASEADFSQTRDAWAQNREDLADTTAGLEALDAAAAQRVADAANDDAIRRLGQATMILVSTEDSLAQYAAELEVEVVAAYKHAGSSAQFTGVVEALEESGSVTEFSNAYEGLLNGTAGQQRLVESVTTLADRITEQRVIVATLQRRTETVERRALTERRHVAALTAEQTSIVEDIRADRAERRRLLVRLRSQQAQFTKRVEALQKQSQALLEELRKYQYVGGAPGSKDLWWPTDGGVTSNFGYRLHPIFKTKRLHAGIDIPAPTGQPIFAAAAGTIIGAGPYGGYGNAVVIDHGGGLSTVYAHQSRLGTTVGETVEAGETIGYVGSTGYSTGPHLHFEVRTGGQPVDPLAWY